MELWNETADWVRYLYNFLLLVLPFLATIAATTGTGAATIWTVKKAYAQWVRPAIDQSNDVIPMLIASQTGKDASWVSRVLLENLDAIIAVLPEEAEAPPLAEKS